MRWELRGNPDAHRLLPFHAHETWIVFPVLAEEESEWRSILPGITRKEWWSRDLSPCLIPKPILSQCVQWVDRARPRGAGGGADPRHPRTAREALRGEHPVSSLGSLKWAPSIQVSGLNYSTSPKCAPPRLSPWHASVSARSDHSPAVSRFGNTVSCQCH